MTELVTYHALQFLARELGERAARDRDRRIGRRVPGRERIDALFLLEHEDLRHRDAGRDRDLLHHVAQAAIGEVAGVLRYRARTELQRHRGTAGAQGRDAVQGTEADDAEHEHAHQRQCAAARPPMGSDQDQQVNRDDDRADCEREHPQHAAGLVTRPVLLFEKVHRGPSVE